MPSSAVETMGLGTIAGLTALGQTDAAKTTRESDGSTAVAAEREVKEEEKK